MQAADAAGHLIWTDRIEAHKAPMDLGAVLRRTCAMVIFCSAEAFQSRAIYRELVLAARSGKAILPVYLDDQLPPDQYLFYLARHQGLRAHDPAAEDRFIAALDALERGRRRWRQPEAPPASVIPLPVRAAAKSEPEMA